MQPSNSLRVRIFSAALNRRRLASAVTSTSGVAVGTDMLVEIALPRLTLYIEFPGVSVSSALAEKAVDCAGLMRAARYAARAPVAESRLRYGTIWTVPPVVWIVVSLSITSG